MRRVGRRCHRGVFRLADEFYRRRDGVRNECRGIKRKVYVREFYRKDKSDKLVLVTGENDEFLFATKTDNEVASRKSSNIPDGGTSAEQHWGKWGG